MIVGLMIIHISLEHYTIWIFSNVYSTFWPLSPLLNLDITGSSLKWNCADGFQRQCYPLLAAWVGDYPEQVMVAQISIGSCPMWEDPKGAPMGHSTFRPLDNSRYQHLSSQLLEVTNVNGCNILVFIQSGSSSSNTLSAVSTDFGGLMNCISCSCVQLETYCTGCSNTRKLEMSRINLTLNSHQYHHIWASSASLHQLVCWTAAPGG